LLLAGLTLLAFDGYVIYDTYRDTLSPLTTIPGDIIELQDPGTGDPYLILRDRSGYDHRLSLTGQGYDAIYSALAAPDKPQNLSRNQAEVQVSSKGHVREVKTTLPEPLQIPVFSSNFSDYTPYLAWNYALAGIGLLVVVGGLWYIAAGIRKK
jgi:hypothetical protein